MNGKETIKQILADKSVTQAELATLAGFKGQSNINGILNRGDHDMRADQLARLADALGCDLIIRDRKNKRTIWEITAE